jgi:hypothetical protein
MEDNDTRDAPRFYSLAFLASRFRSTVPSVRNAIDHLGLTPARYENDVPFYSESAADAISGVLMNNLLERVNEVCPEMRPPELLKFTSEQPVEFTFPEAESDE